MSKVFFHLILNQKTVSAITLEIEKLDGGVVILQAEQIGSVFVTLSDTFFNQKL